VSRAVGNLPEEVGGGRGGARRVPEADGWMALDVEDDGSSLW
jgi:hypothetical protein